MNSTKTVALITIGYLISAFTIAGVYAEPKRLPLPQATHTTTMVVEDVVISDELPAARPSGTTKTSINMQRSCVKVIYDRVLIRKENGDWSTDIVFNKGKILDQFGYANNFYEIKYDGAKYFIGEWNVTPFQCSKQK